MTSFDTMSRMSVLISFWFSRQRPVNQTVNGHTWTSDSPQPMGNRLRWIMLYPMIYFHMQLFCIRKNIWKKNIMLDLVWHEGQFSLGIKQLLNMLRSSVVCLVELSLGPYFLWVKKTMQIFSICGCILPSFETYFNRPLQSCINL